MQKNQFLFINNIIYQIYSIDDFPTMKVTFLNLLKMLLPHTCSSILMADNTDSKNSLCDPVCIPASFTEVENIYLSLEEHDSTRWITLSKQPLLIRESDLTPENERIESNIYKKCYKPYSLHYSIQLYLVHNDIFLGVVTLYRSKADGDFTDDEMFLVKAFSEHLSFRFYQESYKEVKEQSSKTFSMIFLASDYHLTSREAEVLQLIFNEEDNEFISEKLCISGFTLKKHIQNIYRKLGVSTRWDLLKFRK